MSRSAVEQVLVDDGAIRDIAQPKKISQICLTEFSQITLSALRTWCFRSLLGHDR